jgi:putative oxidoreductase
LRRANLDDTAVFLLLLQRTQEQNAKRRRPRAVVICMGENEMYTTKKTHVYALVGRILLSAIFIISAVAKIMEWNGTAQMMAAKGIPAAPVALAIATFIELVGGMAIVFGVFSRVSALVMLLYLIPVTLVMHDFWSVGPAQMNIQLVNFLKNLAIMGGLAMVSAFGPGRYCIGTEKFLYDHEYAPSTRPESPVAPGRT